MANLVRFSPNNEVRRLQREVDDLFDNFFPRLNGSRDNDASSSAVWTPRVDVSETEDHYHVQVDVPGMSKDALHINYQNGTLSVSGERRSAKDENRDDYVRIERQYGRFYRSFQLPKQIKENEIDASYADGVLSITIPKSEATKPRKIEVS